MGFKKIMFILVGIFTIIYAINYIIPIFVATNIWQAIQYNHVGYVRRYLKNGGNPNLVRDNPWMKGPIEHDFTLLMEATRKGNTDIVDLLLSHGANPNAITDDLNRTALLFAVENGDLKLIDLLIKNGADVNYSTEGDGRILVHFIRHADILGTAIDKGNVNIINLLIARGARVKKNHLELAEWLKDTRPPVYEDIIELLQKHLYGG